MNSGHGDNSRVAAAISDVATNIQPVQSKMADGCGYWSLERKAGSQVGCDGKSVRCQHKTGEVGQATVFRSRTRRLSGLPSARKCGIARRVIGLQDENELVWDFQADWRHRAPRLFPEGCELCRRCRRRQTKSFPLSVRDAFALSVPHPWLRPAMIKCRNNDSALLTIQRCVPS